MQPMKTKNQIAQEALRLLVARCPRLVKMCYWAGTSSVAIEELGHRDSFDLDFHTRRALVDVRPILGELQAQFAGAFSVSQAPDAEGSGFSGVLSLPGGEQITIEVLANFEDVPMEDLVEAETAPGIRRVSLRRYLEDKIQCVVERAEARDLIDIAAVLGQHPELEAAGRRAFATQDAVLATERLQAWTDPALRADLEAYSDVDPKAAAHARDRLLTWLKTTVPEEHGGDE
jgi:hypothetical protein